jgi:hypothetical protein
MVEYANGCAPDGSILIDLDLAKPAKKQGASLDGYLGVDYETFADITADDAKTYFNVAWSQYDSLELETEIGEVSFKLDSVTVSVEERKLRATWSPELAQDVSAFHNIDAEAELTALLSEQIAAEIDREIVNRIKYEAKQGAQNCTTPGVFNFAVDSDGRWSMEKVMGRLIQIEREATWIAQETRRGRGNFILTSPEVAATLSMANLITTQFDNVYFMPIVNPVGVSYYGMLANRFKVFVDPYMTYESMDGELRHTLIVGYKGASQYDAGLFYCPYIPVQWYRTTGQEDFGARIGIKTRYGLVSNPYSISQERLLKGATDAIRATNSFYRKIQIVL